MVARSSYHTPCASNAPGQLYVPLHDSDTLRVNGTKIPEINHQNQKPPSQENNATHASSNKWTRYASVASCSARIAELCHRNPVSPS